MRMLRGRANGAKPFLYCRLLACALLLGCAGSALAADESSEVASRAVKTIVKAHKPKEVAKKKDSFLPVRRAESALVKFQNSPFPFEGMVPEKDKPFLDVEDGGRRGHNSARGGIYWEDETYSDRRALLSIPAGFDPRRKAVIVVFFHGNEARLERDVRDRQQVPQQVADSGLNAVFVAPQFAVDALDSSAGHFWEAEVFARFLHEASGHLAELYGNDRAQPIFDRMPVVLVAYSGGYFPAAWSLAVGGADDRIRGLVLLDALYGEDDKFADWLAARHSNAFFFSAYSDSSRDGNAEMQSLLTERHIRFSTSPPSRLKDGTVAFFDAGPDLPHADFVSYARIVNPLAWILAKIPGFPRSR
jgi:hypothetical protein